MTRHLSIVACVGFGSRVDRGEQAVLPLRAALSGQDHWKGEMRMGGVVADRGTQVKPRAVGGVIAAIVLLIVSGVAYRVAAGRLSGISGSASLPRGTLSSLAMEIGDWRGGDIALSEQVIRATDTEDHVSRAYVRRGGIDAVSLFLAYGVRFRDLAPHRPEVCYPGAGWTLEGSGEIDVRTAEGSLLPCRIHHFERGGLDGRRMTVLNYYVVAGQWFRDVSLLRSLGWRGTVDATYVAQVQVACAGDSFQNRCDELVRGFAGESGPVIRALLERAVAAETSEPDGG